MIPDLPLQDPEAGFEERIRPALEAHGIPGPLVIVGDSQGTEGTACSSRLAAANLDALLVHLCPRPGGSSRRERRIHFGRGIPWPDAGPDGATTWGEDAAMSVMYGRCRSHGMASEVFGIEPIEIAGGHFPMVEDPAALAEPARSRRVRLRAPGARAPTNPAAVHR